MRLEIIAPEDWKKHHSNVHEAVFGEKQNPEFIRFDFAMVCEDDKGALIGYGLAKERDRGHVHLSWGGAFPAARGSMKVWKAYKMALDELKQVYYSASSFVENTNKTMLKLNMALGFLIVGLHYENGKIYLEQFLNLRGE